MMMDIESALAHLGHFGPYQLYIFLVSSITVFVVGIVMLSTVFVGGPPDHRCFIPECDLNEFISNYSTSWLNFTIPKESYGFSQCERFNFLTNNNSAPMRCDRNMFSDNEKIPCQKWVFDKHEFINTIVTEWNLVCDDSWLFPLSQSIFMCGVLIGVFLFGSLADRYGRRTIFFFAPLIALTSCIISSYSSSLFIFTLTSSLTAMCVAGMYTVGFVVLIEFISPKSRSLFANIFQIIFTFGELALCIVAYHIRDWRQLQLSIAFPIAITFLMPCLLPESVRWQASNGQTIKAVKTISRAARWNNVKMPDEFSCLSLNDNELKEINLGPLDLLRHKILRRWSINLFFNWIVNSLVFYGLSLQSSNLGSDTYTTFFWLSSIEIPGILITTIAMNYFGRKPILQTLLLIGGFACILPTFIPDEYSWINTWLAVIGKSNISGSFSLIYIYSVEIFPTVLRSTGLGMCSMFSRFGGILAPHLVTLKIFGETFPLLFSGLVSIIAGLLVSDLPETRNRRLPDSIEDIELLKNNIDEEICIFNSLEIENHIAKKANASNHREEHKLLINNN